MHSSSIDQYLQGGKRKRYISYDLYVDTTLNVTDKEDALELAVFKAKHNLVLRASYRSLSWEYQLIGHLLTRVKYPILSEMGKKAILSVIKAVEEHLSAGLCFSRFKWSDIVFTQDGQALFSHVKTIESSPDNRKNTAEDTVNVLDYLVEPKNQPCDLVHLLRLMDTQSKPTLYSIHASLVPLYNRGWAFIQMYEKVKHQISAEDKKKILFKLPYHSNWRAQVHENLVLHETYHFVPGSYDSRPGNKSAVEEQLESIDLFLDFLRNGTSHRAQRSLITTPNHFDLIVFVLFPLILASLQEAILDVVQDGLEFLLSVFNPLMPR